MRSSDIPRLTLLLVFSLAATLALGSALSGGSVARLLSANPLLVSGLFASSVAFFCFLFGLITGDCSWVDRLWSVTPAIYAWYYALHSKPDPRLILMASLITLWAGRLTYNFARRGGYAGYEDYRWAILRRKMPRRAVWEFFNFSFISFYQNLIIFLFVTPLILASQTGEKPLNFADLTFSLLFLGFLTFETIADQQQWDFYRKKKADRDAGQAGQDFLTTGLFRFSRHPNYFAEISLWWIIFLWAAAASDSPFHGSVSGALLLTLLFAGSTRFTESITRSKYPAYRAYQKRTSAVIPWFPRQTGS